MIDASAVTVTGGTWSVNVKLVGSVGGFTPIASGKTAIIRTHDTNGVKRQTADV